MACSVQNTEKSKCPNIYQLFHRVKLRRSNTVVSSKPLTDGSLKSSSGSQVNVCVDCRDMILQIIKAQRANRRAQFTKSLCFA